MYKFFREITCVVVVLLGIWSCNKDDGDVPDVSDKLTNRYCNIPQAVNYNHGFPGIEDNSLCIFGTDYYRGNWIVVDTIKLGDSTLIDIDTLFFNISLMPNDTSYSKMYLRGWCGNENIIMNIDKYYFGRSDTFANQDGWQRICNSDSILISVSKNIMDTSSVIFRISESVNNELRYHIGKGVKQ
jgi:hypothetical protein